MAELVSNWRKGFFFFARVRAYIGKRVLVVGALFALVSTASSLIAAPRPGGAPAPLTFRAAAIALSSTDTGASLQGADFLGRSRNEAAVSVLSQALAGEKRMVVRRAICDALGILRFPSARPALRQALQDSESQVRASAVIALEAIGGSDDVLAQQAANEHDFGVKAHLVQVLGRSKKAESDKALKAMAKDSDAALARMAQREVDRKVAKDKK